VTEPRGGGGRQSLASLAVAANGAIWGLYWLPLRHLEAEGIAGSWATVSFFLASVPLVLVLAVIARHDLKAHGRSLFWLSVANGAVFALYSNAYTLTTVFNVIFLFYLSPVWSVLIARFRYGERIGRARIACVAFGLLGLVLMLSEGGGWPVPRNLGDWMALASGMLWAVVTIFIRRNEHIGAAANAVSFFIGGIWPALIFALATDAARLPSLAVIQATAPLILGVAWIGWIPSQLALFWGVSRISPVRTGILLMTELVSGVISAAWLSGDPLSWRQGLGGALILAAGLGDVLTTRERATPAPVPLTVVPD